MFCMLSAKCLQKLHNSPALRIKLKKLSASRSIGRRLCSTGQDESIIHPPRRAMLYVPANDEKKLKKISQLKPDCIILDCEDGVALNRKVNNQISYSLCPKIK